MVYSKKDYENYLKKVKEFNEERWVQHQLLLQEKPNLWFILEYGEKSVSAHEERTSRMFRWLLDPNETHNLGNVFAHKLFRLIGVDYTYEAGRNSEVKATAEEKRIDVLYKDLSQNVILAIEVKQYAGEGEKDGVSQLEGYEQSVNQMIASKDEEIAAHYIYLTPLKEKATKAHWLPVGYEEFIQIIEEVEAEYLATSRDKYIDDTKKIIADFKDDLQRSIDILKKEGKELNNRLTKEEKALTRQLVTEIQEEMDATHMDKLIEMNPDKDIDLKNTILIMAEYIQTQNHTTNVGVQMLIRKIYNYFAADEELVTEAEDIETYKIGATLVALKQELIDRYNLPYTTLAVTSGDGQGLYFYHEDDIHRAYFSGDAEGSFPNDRVQLLAPTAEKKLAARSTTFNGEKFIIEQEMIEADKIKAQDGKVISLEALIEDYIIVQIKELSDQVAKKN